MARKPQNNSLSSRVSDDLAEQIAAYTEAAEIAAADLVREAVKEYMVNHPVTKGK